MYLNPKAPKRNIFKRLFRKKWFAHFGRLFFQSHQVCLYNFTTSLDRILCYVFCSLLHAGSNYVILLLFLQIFRSFVHDISSWNNQILNQTRYYLLIFLKNINKLKIVCPKNIRLHYFQKKCGNFALNTIIYVGTYVY